MAKPWARYEVGFIGHVKFRALTSNAICLWIEGKNYCDENMTDGLIPTHIAKQFRFYSSKSVALLTASCGTKNEREAFSPLWESHPVGYRMHDYLEYNDCRDEAMARIEDANVTRELRKAANRERQARFRAQRKAALDALRAGVTNGVTNGVTVTQITPLSQTPTETETPTEASTETPKNGDGRRAPLHTTHKNHSHCGRVCLHASLYGEFVRRRNHPGAERDIDEFCNDVEREWGEGGPNAAVETGDSFDFWRARYAERWPAPGAARSDRPITGHERERAMQVRRAWGRCRHDPACPSFADCVGVIVREWREREEQPA